jgi:hypothetical protein
MAGFWEQDAVIAPASQGGPAPVFAAPDPRGDAEEARQNRELQLEEERVRLAQVASAREQEKFDRESPAGKQRESALALLTAAGVDFERGIDPVSDLIRGSTSGRLQSAAANAYGAITGDSTSGMENIAKLATIASDLTLQLTGGSLGSQISNSDREFIVQRVGNIGDPNVPAAQRLAAWEQVKQRMANILGVEYRPPAQAASDGQSDAAADSAAYWGLPVFDAQGNPLGPGGGIGYDAQGNEIGLFGTTTDDTPPDISQARAVDGGVAQSIDAVVRGVADIVTAGYADEVAAALNTVFGGGTMAQNLASERAIDRFDEANNAAERFTGQIAGGFLLPAGRFNTVRGAAGTGATFGAAYGSGSAEGGLADRIEGAGTGAVTGAAAGAAVRAATPALGAAARKIIPRRQGNAEGARVIQAADDLNQTYGTNIRPLPADVGGVTTRRMTGATAQMPLGASPIINAGKAVTAEGEAAKNAIAVSVATPAELEVAGQRALAGAQEWMKSTRNRVNALYTKARKLAEGVKVPLNNARRALDEHIAELEATPGGSEGVAALRELRDEISEEYTIDGIKRMRTTLRDRYLGDGLRMSDLERRVGQVIDAAEQDVADGLLAAGKPEAARAWTVAAAAARDRLKTIDNVLAPIIGRRADAPKSGEQIMQAITRMSKSDNAKLAQFLKAMPEDEAATVRATVISRLGTSNAEAADFSLARFLTQWEKMTPGAKRTLFGGELTEALDNLATVAGGAKEAQRFANFSNTGSAIGLTATGVGGTAGFATAPVLTVAALASQYGLGRLLASPGFARWLARMPANPTAQRQHIAGLSKLADSNQVIAGQARALQLQLMDQFAAGPRALAAQSADREETAGAGR